MSKNIKRTCALLLIFIVLFAAGCKKKEVNNDEYNIIEPEFNYEGELLFIDVDNEFSISYEDIYSIGAMELDIHTTENGEEKIIANAGGVRLKVLVTERGVILSDCEYIRFVSGNGEYADVDNRIIMQEDIFLIYKIDGEYLDEDQRPLMVMMDNVSSEYFVSNLVEVQFIKESIDN